MHSVFYHAPYFKDGKICLQGQGTIDDNRGMKGTYVQQLQTKVGHCANEGLSCPFDIELPAHEAIGVHELIFNSLYRDQLLTEYRWMVVNEEIAPKKENTYSIPAQVTSELDEKIIIFDKSLDQLGEEILKLYPYTKPLLPKLRKSISENSGDLIAETQGDPRGPLRHIFEAISISKQDFSKLLFVDCRWNNSGKLW
uniref:Uncharacterized protein n=1 Tax=Acrobeloides nanus TaxID=290746 RepID=A0A914CXS0_9BILA